AKKFVYFIDDPKSEAPLTKLCDSSKRVIYVNLPMDYEREFERNWVSARTPVEQQNPMIRFDTILQLPDFTASEERAQERARRKYRKAVARLGAAAFNQAHPPGPRGGLYDLFDQKDWLRRWGY